MLSALRAFFASSAVKKTEKVYTQMISSEIETNMIYFRLSGIRRNQ